MINDKKGIYVITCKVNDKKYVGYTMDSFIARWSYHVADFQTGINNKYMQEDFNKYGLLNFEMEILEEIEYGNRDYFLQKEQHWMAVLASINPKYGYNIVFGNYGARKHRTMKEFAETKKKLTREISLFIYSDKIRLFSIKLNY